MCPKSHFLIRITVALALFLILVSTVDREQEGSKVLAAVTPPKTLSLVSSNIASTNGGNDDSQNSVVSADGRFVAFTSSASDLSSQIDNNGQPDVFIRDRFNNTTELISRRNSSNFSANGPSGRLAFDSTLGMSADGRFVVYSSEASDLVPLDHNGLADVFVYDRVFGINRLVSFKSTDLTASANGPSGKAAISANGQIIVYTSTASDLSSANDTNGLSDVYALNLNTLVTKLVSINTAGTNGGNDVSSATTSPSISADGRFVAFDSQASNLISNDTNGSGLFGTDVLVRDLQSNSTMLVSANNAGTGSGNVDSFSSEARISADGHFVVFASRATDLVTGVADVNGANDIFRRDLIAGTTALVSINVAGNGTGLNLSQSPVVSDDGRYVAFVSNANNLVGVDTNNGLEGGGGIRDVFVRDMQLGLTKLVSINSAGTDSANSSSNEYIEMSGDGHFVLFTSGATNLTNVSDLNSSADLFLRDMVAGSTSLVSTSLSGNAGRANVLGFGMSADAGVITFEGPADFLVLGDNNGKTDIFALAAPYPALAVNDVTVIEGDSGTTDAVFTVTLTNGPTSSNVTTTAVTIHGTATELTDFQMTSTPLTFAPGETTKTVTVPIIGDLLYEGNETFGLELENVIGATVADSFGTCTIIDNETPPSISVNDITVVEGDSGTTNAVFTITLSGPSAVQAGFSFTLSDGTAVEEEDFGGVGGGVSFFPGTTSRTITVPIIGDTLTENDETFFINLANPGNATIADGQGVCTIKDNETATASPTFQVSKRFQSVSEGAGSLEITVTRSGNSSSPAKVDYLTTPNPNSSVSDRTDFTLALGTLEFGPGETSKSFTLLITDDAFFEGNEIVIVNLSNPIGATIGLPNSSIVKIVDNDVAPPTSNPIDTAPLFVRQHYHDFLNREPDPAGYAFWQNEITQCGNDAVCTELKRINVSAAFFLSIEFQETGYLVYRIYKSGFGNLPGTPVPVRLTEFLRDTQHIGLGVQVGIGDWQAQLESNKQQFALAFVQRPEFLSAYPSSMTADQFVTTLDTNAGGVLSANEKADLLTILGATPSDVTKRAEVLRSVAEDPDLRAREFNKAFVLTQYFGYLRRNPNDSPDSDFGGYNFWLAKLDQFGGNFIQAEMVKAFISSIEYRTRFGP